MKVSILLVTALCLAACDRSDPVSEPGAVTVGEARALAEAAQMLPAPTAIPEPTASATGEQSAAAPDSGS